MQIPGKYAPEGTAPHDLADLLPKHALPPCRLSTQQLVELLKMPTCIGPARRVILDHLANRYHRPFADVWAFVRFAKANLPAIDLLSPPRRPEEMIGGAKP